MNSALKPVLTSSSPQNPPVSTQLNKPMHPQTTGSYGQPQNLVNLPHNPTVAHSHPNPAHQTNHYSLNVPNAPQHYSPTNPAAIPASNHPVPVSQTTSYSPSKSVTYAGGYQPNLGHPPNQNLLPPVSQSLPASQPTHHSSETTDKPQSNGTTETKSPTKTEPQENHVSVPKDNKSSQPSSPKVCERSDEKPASATALPEEKPQQKQEEKEEKSIKEKAPEVRDSNVAPSEDKAETTVPTVSSNTEPKSETSDNVESQVDSQTEAAEPQSSPNKPKDTKEQSKSTPSAKSTPTKTSARKSKTPKLEGESPRSSKVDNKSTQKSPIANVKSKRTRTKTQPYQSPLPEIEIITKITSSTPRNRSNDEKLIVFYKNEFLAVRNAEGSFYICQAVQNIYKSSTRIRIRWLSQDKTEKSGEIYTPDFYDHTDFDCILTNLNLVRVDKGRYRLPPAEKERTDSILKRSLAVEKGEVTSPSLTEEHPDGIDVSLYKEESQLKKRKTTKRKASSALKINKKTDNTTKSPDQAKVRKIAAKTSKKTAAKKLAVAKTKKPIAEVKKTMTLSRTDRAKRRSDNQNHNKVSPIVDQKKARVLAKVARKGPADGNKSQAETKNTKASKATKVQKSAKSSTKKTKRSSKK